MDWNKAIWSVSAKGADFVTLERICLAGPYPGDLKASVTYAIGPEGELVVSYNARCNATTPASLTNHAYFNLSAGTDPTSREHTLQMNCSGYNPDNGSGDGVPIGRTVPCAGTVRDYRSPTSLGTVIDSQAADSPQWPHGEEFVVDANRYDDPNRKALDATPVSFAPGWVWDDTTLPLAAVLSHARSGRVMKMFTSEPTIQTYYSTLLGNCGGRPCKHEYVQHGAVCLEAQRYANAENNGAPSRLITPTQTYSQLTVFKFSTT